MFNKCIYLLFKAKSIAVYVYRVYTVSACYSKLSAACLVLLHVRVHMHICNVHVHVGGVGFDINCGVRLIRTNLTEKDVSPVKEQLAQVVIYMCMYV